MIHLQRYQKLDYCGDVRSRTSYNLCLYDLVLLFYCGDVRSRTSYNFHSLFFELIKTIAVTFDLGRVTTLSKAPIQIVWIAVTFDLGRVTT